MTGAEISATADRANGSGRATRPPAGVIARTTAIWLILAAVAASTLYPLGFILLTALRTQTDYGRNPNGLPSAFTLSNISQAWSQASIGSYALHSLIVVLCAVALIVVCAFGAAFALSQMRFRFRGPVLALIVVMMMIPSSVLMVPTFKVVLSFGLLNSYAGLVLVYAALQLPFSIYLLASFMGSIPNELVQAGRIDGATYLRAARSIVLPLAKPGIMTVITLNFLALWNELLFSLLILQNPSQRTLTVGLSQLNNVYGTDTPVVAAGLLLSMIPPLLIFVVFQRGLVRGLTAGAVR
jgi:multiple sugar transport system permease protein/raffinose/stachyose/melibiose transport system permease protein